MNQSAQSTAAAVTAIALSPCRPPAPVPRLEGKLPRPRHPLPRSLRELTPAASHLHRPPAPRPSIGAGRPRAPSALPCAQPPLAPAELSYSRATPSPRSHRSRRRLPPRQAPEPRQCRTSELLPPAPVTPKVRRVFFGLKPTAPPPARLRVRDQSCPLRQAELFAASPVLPFLRSATSSAGALSLPIPPGPSR
jgi:hypothetical protein